MSVLHLFICCLHSASLLVQCPFLEVLVGANPPPLSSQQGSCINKRTAPRCTIMAKNELPSVGLPMCCQPPHIICVYGYAVVCVPDCEQVSNHAMVPVLPVSVISLPLSTCVFFLMCFILSGSTASVLSQSITLPHCLAQCETECLPVSLSAASSAFIVSPSECCTRQP